MPYVDKMIPLQQTMFGLFFYSKSLFTYHTFYSNKIFDLAFQWKKYCKPNVSYKSVVSTKTSTEIIRFNKDREIVYYSKYKR